MQVLDTHVWLWWMSGDERLKPVWNDVINNDTDVGVSAISLFEVSGISLLPITPAIAMKAVRLPEHHSGPQDRLIMATALEHNAGLLSADTKFKLYEELESILVR